jgi:hypothetical protein
MSINKNKKINQKGGDGSDFSGLWHSWEISPAELSRVTLENIDCSPMFNPLRKGTIFPTGTSGIIPSGVYLASMPAAYDICTTVECVAQKEAERQARKELQGVRMAETGGVGPQTGGSKKKQTGGCNYGCGCGCTSCKMNGGCCGQQLKQLGGCGGCGGRGCSGCGGRGGCGCGGRGGCRQLGGCCGGQPKQQQSGGCCGGQPKQQQGGGSQPATYKGAIAGCQSTCKSPVYYSVTQSEEACTTRCGMPQGTYASSDLGCRAQAFCSSNRDYGTYDAQQGPGAPVPKYCGPDRSKTS